jgi:beta-lactam-binding protein with PASTA domain
MWVKVVVGAIGAAAVAAGGFATAATGSPDAVRSTSPTAVAASKVRVPNEVGRNHQAAQNDLQAHGFYNLREKDCSGRERLLVWDRNWKVIRQSPKAGSRVSTNRAITLCSVKYTD